MKKSKEIIEEIYIVTNQNQIELMFKKYKTKKGKFKNYIETYKPNWLNNRKNRKEFEEYLKSKKQENPNVKIHFITKKQLNKNKDLKNIVRGKIKNAVSGTLVTLLWALLLFNAGYNSINFFGDTCFYIVSTLTPIMGALQFHGVKQLIKKVFPKSMKLAYTLEALLCSLVLSMTSLYSMERDSFFSENRIEENCEEENSIFNSIETPEEKIELLTNTLENNPNLKEEDVKKFENLHSYYLENPYLDYEYLNKVYGNLKISRENINGIVAGYVKNSNMIENIKELNGMETYNKEIVLDTSADDKTDYHEKIHLTGEFPYSFLNEGMTVCLTDEFYETDIHKSTDDYYQASVFIRLLSELVGSDTVLESYSKKDIRILNEGLREIIPDTKLLKNVYYDMESVNTYFKELQEIAEYEILCNSKYSELITKKLNQKYEELLITMNPYFEEKWGIDVKNIYTESSSSLPEEYMRIILDPKYPDNKDPEEFKKYFNTEKQYMKTR